MYEYSCTLKAQQGVRLVYCTLPYGLYLFPQFCFANLLTNMNCITNIFRK